jgi:hypothetical protein
MRMSRKRQRCRPIARHFDKHGYPLSHDMLWFWCFGGVSLRRNISTYAAVLIGDDLQLIEKTGWTADGGGSHSGNTYTSSGQQTLKVLISWPPRSPTAPLHIWLRRETQARKNKLPLLAPTITFFFLSGRTPTR